MSFSCILLIIQLINTMRILTVTTVMAVEVKGENKIIVMWNLIFLKGKYHRDFEQYF